MEIFMILKTNFFIFESRLSRTAISCICLVRLHITKLRLTNRRSIEIVIAHPTLIQTDDEVLKLLFEVRKHKETKIPKVTIQERRPSFKR